MATVSNNTVTLEATVPKFTRFVPAATTWIEVDMTALHRQAGANRIAILIEGGGKITHAGVTKGDAPAAGDDYGIIPTNQWFYYDFDPASRPTLFVSADNGSSSVCLHASHEPKSE